MVESEKKYLDYQDIEKKILVYEENISGLKKVIEQGSPQGKLLAKSKLEYALEQYKKLITLRDEALQFYSTNREFDGIHPTAKGLITAEGNEFFLDLINFHNKKATPTIKAPYLTLAGIFNFLPNIKTNNEIII